MNKRTEPCLKAAVSTIWLQQNPNYVEKIIKVIKTNQDWTSLVV